MLRSLKDLDKCEVSAVDGDIGNVLDFLVDDARWTVRYLVVQTSGILDGRRVLVSPISFRDVDWKARRFHVALTKDKIQLAPSIDADKPVSRQHEMDYNRYFGYQSYWGSGFVGLWGMSPSPSALVPSGVQEAPPGSNGKDRGDSHLRSVDQIRGYHVQGSDEAIGHIDDFLVDDSTWEIRYLVVDTSNWWFGKKVLVAPQWARSVSWADKRVDFDITRATIKGSPEWDGQAAMSPQDEARLQAHHGRAVSARA